MIWIGINLLLSIAWLLHEIERAPTLPWHD